jgi:hypothetical protein
LALPLLIDQSILYQAASCTSLEKSFKTILDKKNMNYLIVAKKKLTYGRLLVLAAGSKVDNVVFGGSGFLLGRPLPRFTANNIF